MLPSQLNSSPKRANPFGRSSPSPAPHSQTRPKSAILSPSNGLESARGHLRNASVSQITPNRSPAAITRQRSNSARKDASPGTFAPSFIRSEELRRGADQVRGLEGDNDFSGNKYVWLRDAEKAFVRGLVLEELEGGCLLVQTDDGEVGVVSTLRESWAGLTLCIAAGSGCRPG
jgi:myosin protein heavy chain